MRISTPRCHAAKAPLGGVDEQRCAVYLQRRIH
jgi:ribosomal protein L34E